MENATKALMIAGAVLLAIMIIAAGMLIFNQSNNVMGQVGNKADEMKVNMFNEPFQAYVGNSIPGSSVKALVSAIITNNNRSESEGTQSEELVSFNGKTKNTELSTERTSINTGKKYNVEITEYYPSGYIKTITAKDVNEKK